MKRIVIPENKLRVLKESPDTVRAKNPYEIGFYELKWNDWSAIAFGIYDSKMYVGYNRFYANENGLSVSSDLRKSSRSQGHMFISTFYDDLFGDTNDLMAYERSDFKFSGRIWLTNKVISFWEQPKSQSELENVIKSLSNELNRIYNIKPDFNNFLVEIDDKDGYSVLTPINEYEKNFNPSYQTPQTQHAVSPLEKDMDNPQRKAFLKHRNEISGKKLGNMSQAQYNSLKSFSEGKLQESLGISDEVMNVSNKIVEKLLTDAKKNEQNNFTRYNILISDLSFIGKLWIDCILLKNDENIDESETTLVNPIIKDNKIYDTIDKSYSEYVSINMKIYSPNDVKTLKEIIVHEVKHIYDTYILLKKGEYNGQSQLTLNNYQHKDFQNPDVQTVSNIIYYTGDDGELSTYTHQTYQELLNGVDYKKTSLYTIYNLLQNYKDKINKPNFDWESVQWTIYNETKNGKTPNIDFIKKDVNKKIDNGMEQYKKNLGKVLSKIKNNDTMLEAIIETVIKEEPDYEIGFESDGPMGYAHISEDNQTTSEQKLAPNGATSNLTPELWNIVRTSEFKNWFGDWENNPQNASKIVDENGEPLVVYHGSKNEFDIFDLNKSGSSTGSAYGVGSYFTDSEDAAYDYGFNIYNVFLNIRKPFNLKKKTITPTQIQRFFTEIHKVDPNALSNYGDVEYEGFNKVLKDAIRITYDYSDNDAEIMGGLINAGVSDTKTILNYFINICKKDGFIDKYGQDGNDKVFVALSSSQIKNIKAKSFDNKNDNMYENKTIIFKSPHIRILKENLESEVNAGEVSLHSFKPQSELCPKIWVNNKMNSRVRLKLLDIADDFINELNVPWVDVNDIIVTGSLANYNWSKFSDIDLHILIDFSKVDEKVNFVKEYFDAKKKIWNDTHQNLKIYGFPIEVYVQDINETHTSSGYYSLERNEWIVEPKINNEKIGLDKYTIKEKAAKIMTIIDGMWEQYENPNLDDYDLVVLAKDIKKLWDKIKGMRRESLKCGGEMSIGNIIFKVLRRCNYLDKIWHLKRGVYDLTNSLK